MRPLSIMLAAAGAVSVLAVAAPARADWDDWRDYRRPDWNDRWGDHAWQDRGWRDNDWRERQRGWDRGYYGCRRKVEMAPGAQSRDGTAR